MNDCGDGSDEEHCNKTTCKPVKEFTCASGACVDVEWRCDGEIDCDDGSDEKVTKRLSNSEVKVLELGMHQVNQQH